MAFQIKLASHDLCSGCGACYSICVKKAISMSPDKDGFRYPVINKLLCVGCGCCQKHCPVLQKQQDDSPHFSTLCFAAKANDHFVRQSSSSGGIFTVLSSQVLKEGGIVFGCVWDDDFLSVKHIEANSFMGIEKMRGSKYLQSNLFETFHECQDYLKSGKKVLYSGTPCQIAGLNAYLGRKWENLITLEIICHGVPAPAVWRKYLCEIKETVQSFSMISFRDKAEEGWKRYHLSFIGGSAQRSASLMETGEQRLSQYHWDNPYMKAFLRNLSLRDSCYHCSCKGGSSKADITLGDFWGIEKVFPSFDDNKGVSAVILHSDKAETLWNLCENEIQSATCDLEQIQIGNPSYENSVSMPKRRNCFMRKYHSTQIEYLLQECMKLSFPQKIIHFLKSCFKSLLSAVKRKIK